MLNEEYLRPYMQANNIESPDRVRMKTFYKEDVCLAIEDRAKHLQRVFTDHCSTVNHENGQFRMQLKDFLALFKHAQLYDTWFAMADARVVFVMSILITENELTSNEVSRCLPYCPNVSQHSQRQSLQPRNQFNTHDSLPTSNSAQGA